MQEMPKKPLSKIVTLKLGLNHKNMEPSPYRGVSTPEVIMPKHRTIKEKQEINEFDIQSMSSISSISS